ncbi:MAG TPA: metallophosphoesterase family protein [Gemmataceae bacterium]|nr:metallophosphoesterase family protein [Gemmataceae bacterium]
MYDAVIISDIHLGSPNCQAKRLCTFLETIAYGELAAARIILNGDVFDSIDFRRLKKSHWKVLSLLRTLSDKMEIIWICGNHDGSAEIVSHLLGVRVADEFVLASGDRKILILHGHGFDEFLDAHPVLNWFADTIYLLLQKLDKTHYFAKLAKKKSKTFLRCARVIEEKSVKYAASKKCAAVCCGHTHHAVDAGTGQVHYFNSGCWTELPCSYLTVADGRVELHTFNAGAGNDEPDVAPATVPFDLPESA